MKKYLSLFLLILCSCVNLGPDYRPPKIKTAEQWSKPSLELTLPEQRWWEHAFADPVLNDLIEHAFSHNLSLRSAALRVLQARESVAIATGNQFPQQQQIGASYGEKGTFANSDRDKSSAIGLSVSWELDFWGKYRRELESATASFQATQEQYNGVALGLICDIANTYFAVVTLEERIAIVRKNLRLQRESRAITKAKVDAGDTTELDYAQAESLVYNTEAFLQSLYPLLANYKISLAILLGQQPAEQQNLRAGAKLVSPDGAFLLGTPQDILRNRPDLRQAERALAAQSAQIGVAINELYPQLSIGGSVGSATDSATGSYIGDIFQSDSSIWSGAVSLKWNIFNYGRLRSNIRLQDARFQELLENYRQQLLSAQGEVERNVNSYIYSKRQSAAYLQASNASARAVKISNTQYRDGLVEYNVVLQNLQSLTNQQDKLVSAKGDLLFAFIATYKSLGLGWQPYADPKLPVSSRQEMLKRTPQWQGGLPAVSLQKKKKSEWNEK